MGRFELSCAITEAKANVTSNTVKANRRVLIRSPSELKEEGRMEFEESAEEHGTKVDEILQDCPIFRQSGQLLHHKQIDEIDLAMSYSWERGIAMNPKSLAFRKADKYIGSVIRAFLSRRR
jgi:hypothetical protein